MPNNETGQSNFTFELRPQQPDPWSRKAIWRIRSEQKERVDGDDRLMTSPRLMALENYLDRYCKGEIDGFSVLLAGQRGAGKTTATNMLIQRATLKSEDLIPLPIFLHGPTVIDPKTNSPEDEKPKKDDPVVQGGPVNVYFGATPAVPAKSIGDLDEYEAARKSKENALPKLMSSLYIALSEAIYHAWRNAAESSQRPTRETVELAAHVDRLLELAPGVETLRKIWARAGFLHSGVAFYLRSSDPTCPKIAGDPNNQGLREIVALAACAHAYRGVVGDSATDELRMNSSSEQRRQRGLPPATAEEKAKDEKQDTKSKDETAKLGPPAFGVATGGIAAIVAGKEASLPQFAISALLGALVWIVTWYALNYDVRRQSRQALERESRITMDLKKIRHLERMLPGLLLRVKDAGFAPIFVFDELDKLREARAKLDNFLTLSKHFNDHAAFFFLVDKNYFEEVEMLDRDSR